MAKSITLINPTGQSKDLFNWEFFALKIEFSKTAQFIKWAEEHKVSAYPENLKSNPKGLLRFNPVPVDQFLKEMGYKIIQNENT